MTEFASGEVTVPGGGKVKKKLLLIPAGLAVAYVGFRWYQARQDAAAAPDQSSGLYSTTDLTDTGLATTGGESTVTGNTGNTSTDATNPNAIDTNAEWTQRAVELLGNAGYDSATVYAALGEFLARRSLDKTEATIARAALAAAGQPPTGGPYSVLEQAGTDTGTLAAPTNLRAYNKPTDTVIGLQWDSVPGALHYRIYRTDQGDEPIGDSVDTKFNARGLTPNHSYAFFVRAVGTTNKLGGKSSVYTGRTAQRKLGKPGGLKASNVTKSSFRVSCTPVGGAEFYRWYVNGKGVSPSDRPYRDFTGLKSNTSYHISVAADLHTQSPGPTSNSLSVKTKR
jgi:hypothetical protein